MNQRGTTASKKKPNWFLNDNYSRTVPLFTITCLLIVVNNYIVKNLMHFIAISSVIVFFYVHQYFRANLFTNYFTSSKFTYQKPPFLLLSSILFFINYEIANMWSDSICSNSYKNAYTKSLLKSTALFSLSMFAQCLFIKIGIFRPQLIRMGVIGVMQRVFIAIRSHCVNTIWVEFLKKYSSPRHGTVFGLIKGSMMLYLLFDFYKTLFDFIHNRKKLLVSENGVEADVTCAVCFEGMKEPILLQCGHTFCYSCLVRCAETKVLCPMCREPFIIPTKVEMSNGEISFMFLMASI
jgi:hypothetical protein